MLKTLVIYLHLLATCVALGSIIRADIQLWLNRHKPLKNLDLVAIKQLKNLIATMLGLLWITGATLVLLGYLSEGSAYLLNEKLWAKVVVVTILTINGVLLHKLSFNWLKPGLALSELPTMRRRMSCCLTSVSSASWLFAAFLGIARPWSYQQPIEMIALYYVALLAGAIAVAHLSMGRFAPNKLTYS